MTEADVVEKVKDYFEADVVEKVKDYFNDSRFSEFRVREQVHIAIGATNGLADIVLSDPDGRFFAIAECKRPDMTAAGLKQLKSYLAASNTRFGLLAASLNSEKWGYWENIGTSKFRPISKSDFESRVLREPPGVCNPQGTLAQQVEIQRLIDLHASLADEAQVQQEEIQQQTEEIQQQKKAIGKWKYAALGLGIGLLLSFVVMLMLFFKSQPLPPRPGPVLIPAGEFQMGSDVSDAESDEKPTHMVHVDAFYIDKYEVTNAQYKKFVDANPQWHKDRIPSKFHNGEYLDLWQGNSYPPDKENHPVVFVSWYAAMAYAKWEGKRLPTEAEWERAARGGLVDLKYTWGNKVDLSKANYGGLVGDTTPVGAYPANDYGLYDMVGNVMEWCLDAYETDFYSRSPRLNPIAGGVLIDIINNFQGIISRRAVRSGCWYNVPLHVRVADRYGATPIHASKGRGFVV